jgi:hypothetical protein
MRTRMEPSRPFPIKASRRTTVAETLLIDA